MTNLHNTLYVTTQGAYLRKDHENVAVRVERATVLAVPLHHLAGIVCLGRVSVSPGLMKACGESAISLSFLSPTGRFIARVEGPTSGSVLLRRCQFRLADDPVAAAKLARAFVVGKVANARTLLQRGAREADDPAAQVALEEVIATLGNRLRALETVETVESLRGHEGEAAALYFGVFNRLLRRNQECFHFATRNRRPPTDPINALLSFLYALIVHDAGSALQSVGLDPAAGYLHVDRPGRPSLALDLAEEFRASIADRLAVALINLGQLSPDSFAKGESGAVSLTDVARKAVIVAYQKRKQEEIVHPFTDEKTTLGLVVHVQARLLARVIRGDLDAYPPFLIR